MTKAKTINRIVHHGQASTSFFSEFQSLKLEIEAELDSPERAAPAAFELHREKILIAIGIFDHFLFEMK